MSQAELFEKLGAPLKNVRWSWGGVRESDKTIFLRVWQDGTKTDGAKRYIWISDETPPSGDLGAAERLVHVNLVQSGYSCYLVMCQAVDTNAIPRAVQSYNENEVFVAGEVILFEGFYWIEFKDRVRVKNVCV